jgi:hypothetical protein
VSCSSSGHVYGDIYMGKIFFSRVYVAVDATVNIVARVQVCKQVFEWI